VNIVVGFSGLGYDKLGWIKLAYNGLIIDKHLWLL